MPQNDKNIDWKNRLPIYSPDNHIWDKIERQLDFDSMLVERIAELPSYEPGFNVWEKISHKLPKNKITRVRFSHWTAVASIAGIMILSTVLFQMIRNNTHSIFDETKSILAEKEMEHAAINEIRTYCNLHQTACEQNNLTELMQLYDELNTEESALKDAMTLLGDSPEMIQALIKIKNLKSETIQDMILKIQS